MNEGVSFCAADVVLAEDAQSPTGPANCQLNNIVISHGASVLAYQSANVAAGTSCVSQQRFCNDGVLSGSFTNSTCAVAAVTGSAGCSFNGVAIAHGASVTAYQTASVSAGSSCISQQRQCNNGTLNGNYNYNSCSVLPPTTPAVDNCSGTPVHFDLNASETYKRLLSGDYSNYGMAPLTPAIMGNNQHMIIRLTVNANDTTTGRQAAAFTFGDIGPIRAGRYVTISKTKCDYSASALCVSGRDIVNNQPVAQNSASRTILINDNRSAGSGEAKITTGVWYINIKNTECPQGAVCDVVSTWSN